MLAESANLKSSSITAQSAGCHLDRARIVQARRRLNAAGETVSEWARHRGYSPRLVYAILEGRRACLRGKSHEIAVALGIKDVPVHG